MGCCVHGQPGPLPAHPVHSADCPPAKMGLEEPPTLLTSGLRSAQLRSMLADKEVVKANHTLRPVHAASTLQCAQDERDHVTPLTPTSPTSAIAEQSEGPLACSSMFLPLSSPVASSCLVEQADISRFQRTNASDDMYDDSTDPGSDSSCCNTRLSDAKRGCSLPLRQASTEHVDSSTPKATHEDRVEIQDSLACNAWEFASVVRAPLRCEEDFSKVGAQLVDAHDFVADALPRLAQHVGAMSPAVVFQALLTNRKADVTALRSTVALAGPVRRTVLDGLESTELYRLAACAQGISDLLRVKIGDDSDIALARDVTKECLQFLDSLQEAARRRKTSSWNLFSQLRSECS